MTVIERQLRFNSNHADRLGAPTGIVLHHAAANGSVEDIHAYHKHQNGWAGIGYHFYVRKDGTVYRGRPETWLGAHTTGHNDKLGICAEGNFDEETMPAVQQKAIVALLRHLFAKYGEMTVYAHHGLDATACPGKQYPLAVIIEAAKADVPQTNAVQEFQQAALADGLSLAQYGDDGIWGTETAGAASALVQNGSVGNRVRLIQTLLIENGHNLRVYGADGKFGDETESAVKAYQRKNGLAADGIVGINTWMSLLGV